MNMYVYITNQQVYYMVTGSIIRWKMDLNELILND